jgi:hypothetical protein
MESSAKAKEIAERTWWIRERGEYGREVRCLSRGVLAEGFVPFVPATLPSPGLSPAGRSVWVEREGGLAGTGVTTPAAAVF